MTLTAKEIQSALDDYQQRFWDEDHPDYDEDKSDDGINSVWDVFMYDADFKSFELPALGVMEKIESGTELTAYDEKSLFIIVKIGEQFFKMEGWSDSWSGETGWDGPFYEVEAKQVTKTVWEKKNDD